jgi:MioC protein
MAAEDMAAVVAETGGTATIVSMEDFDVSGLTEPQFAIVITSTYGEGELPETTQPFYDALKESRPDLSSFEFAAFGLGDSTYATYGNGIDVVSALLEELGARQVGETGRHDAAKGQSLAQAATNWAREILPMIGKTFA